MAGKLTEVEVHPAHSVKKIIENTYSCCPYLILLLCTSYFRSLVMAELPLNGAAVPSPASASAAVPQASAAAALAPGPDSPRDEARPSTLGSLVPMSRYALCARLMLDDE